MRRAVIIHRWGATPESDWYSWLKTELEQRGYDVLVPAMPETDRPDIVAWTGALGRIVQENAAEELLLVGHSIGCQTILRTLASGSTDVRRVLFVAGWISLSNLSNEEEVIARPWLTTGIMAADARRRIGSSAAFFSRDDPLIPLSNQAFFRSQVGSEIIILDKYGHFDEDAKITKVPELLSYI